MSNNVERVNSSLLPPNATAAERAIESATDQYIPVPIETLWDPYTCPEKLLPWLAWALAVGNWDPAWPESVRRRVIADSIPIYMKKGTRAAVERAVRALGSHIGITEWWEMSPPGPPFTFSVVLDTGAGSSTGVLQRHLIRAINDSKNERSHYTLTVASNGTAVLQLYGFSRVATFMRIKFNDV